jgi:hypothetical protein
MSIQANLIVVAANDFPFVISTTTTTTTTVTFNKCNQIERCNLDVDVLNHKFFDDLSFLFISNFFLFSDFTTSSGEDCCQTDPNEVTRKDFF